MPRQMKDSGVEWIGDIPSGWSTSKLKYLGQYINGYAFKPDDWGNEGRPIIRIQDLTGSNDKPNYYSGEIDSKYEIENGDILVSWAATLNAFIWNKGSGLLNQHIFKAVPDLKKIDYDFFFWMLKEAMGNMNNDNKHGIFMQHVTLDVFNNFSIPLPSLEEQRNIANFLDSKCAYIDSVIEKTKESIEEYKKLKQAIITEAVNVEGDYCKVSHLGELKNGLNFNDSSDSSDVRFLGVADFKNYFIMDEFDMFSEFHSDEVPEEYLLQSGDIVFVRSNGSKELVGRSVMVDNIDYRLTYGGFCIRFRNNRNDLVLSKYLLYFFRSQLFRENIKKMCFSTNINNLSQDMIKSVRISLPSLAVQEEIVHAIDKKCKDIDLLVDYKEQTIYELDVYKKSLIYEYVTGKKEVPAS